jgi:hypothetical protein
MIAQMLALSAVGFTVPNSAGQAARPDKLLALRGGGVSTDVLYNTIIGLNVMVGLQGWLTPKTTMEMYGPKEISESETAFLRVLSGLNLVAGVTMISASTDIDKAASVALTGWALSTAANVPLLEKLGAPKGPLVGTVTVLGVLGELARQGKISGDLAHKIVAAFLIPVSILEITPKGQEAVLDQFGMPKASPLAKSLLSNFSFTKLSVGLFLLVSKMTGKKGLGLVASSASTVVNVAMTAARAPTVGLEKGGLAFWGVMNSAIALLALMNEK